MQFSLKVEYSHPNAPLEALRESVEQHLKAYGFTGVEWAEDDEEIAPLSDHEYLNPEDW